MEQNDISNIDQLWQRIAKIRQYFCDGNNVLFATKISKDPTYTSQLCNGSKNAGSKILKEILNAFPEVRNAWLLTGDGQMLNTPSSAPTTASQCAVDVSACEIERLKSVCEERERTISVLAETNKNLLAEVQQLRNYVNITSTKYIQIVEKTLASAMDTNSTVKVLQSQIGFVTRGNTRLSVSATAEENVHSEH